MPIGKQVFIWCVVIIAMLFSDVSAQTVQKHVGKKKSRSTTTSNAAKQKVSYGKYDFTLQTLDGKSLKLSDYSGKVVLVNIWAPWCGPCKLETPGFIKLYDHYHGKGFEIIGVAVQTNESDTRTFLQTYHAKWPIGIKDEVADNYGTYALPDNYLFGRDGTLIEHFVGLTNEDRLRPLLEKAVQ